MSAGSLFSNGVHLHFQHLYILPSYRRTPFFYKGLADCGIKVSESGLVGFM